LRVRRGSAADEGGWLDATFRLDTIAGAVVDVLSLGPDICVIEPAELRQAVADSVHRAALLYPTDSNG
jgi:predicted DNA-binding transcriptional regulator YafY